MKKVVLTIQKKLELQESDNLSTTDDDVIIKVTKASICGSDLHYWELGQPQRLVMGHEFAGVVLEPGNR